MGGGQGGAGGEAGRCAWEKGQIKGQEAEGLSSRQRRDGRRW